MEQDTRRDVDGADLGEVVDDKESSRTTLATSQVEPVVNEDDACEAVAAAANDATDASGAITDADGGITDAASAATRYASRLVVPGRVIYLAGREGRAVAVEGDGRMAALQRIHISQHAISDHSLQKYASALRLVWQGRGQQPSPRRPPPFAAVDTPLHGWSPCGVCGSDVTWTSPVVGSDAWRVYATHHCRACGDGKWMRAPHAAAASEEKTPWISTNPITLHEHAFACTHAVSVPCIRQSACST